MKTYLGLVSRSLIGLMIFTLVICGGARAETTGAAIPLPAADKAQLEALLGAAVVGEALPSPPLSPIDTYMPPKGSSISYKILEAKKPAATETHKVEDATEAPYSPGWRYLIEGVGAQYLVPGSNGSVEIAAEQDLDHKVLTRFTPGEPLIIPGLKPGESKSATLKVAVYDLSDLKKVTHSGSLDVTYTYVGTYRVKVPAGTYDAALIRWNYSGKVGPATIKDSQYRFLAPKAGMVAMIQIRSISAMLVYNDHTKLGKILEREP